MNVASLARSGDGLLYRLARRTYDAYLGAWYTLTSRHPIGTNVLDAEWDVLVVLDACRVDALREVAPEYDFLDVDDVETRWSVGSHSMEWLAKTFTTERRDAIRNTAYLTANTHAHLLFVDGQSPPYERSVPGWPDWNVVDEEAFQRLEMVWKHGHDERLGNTPARRMTDRLVDLARNWAEDTDRIVAHYMQPHAPYVASAVETGDDPLPVEREPLDALAAGEISRERVWDLYLDNLRYVLDDVALALENVDAERVVITADHGEAFGEWGDVDHREGFLHPAVKRVPWVETSAVDRETYHPESSGPESTEPDAAEAEESESTDDDRTDVESHLADLGYL